MAVSAAAQAQSVQQSGKVTPRHGALWVTNGVAKDAGGAAGGPVGTGYSEIGITNTGLPFCINDAPITGPYHQFCLGAGALGSGLISFNAVGGASVDPLRFNINNAFYDFPGNGQGNMLGPNSSRMLDLVVFNNTAGTLVRGSDLGFRASGTMSGTLTPSPIDAQVAPYGQMAITSDTATDTACFSGVCSGIPTLALYHAFGGMGSGGGGRIGIWSNLVQVGDLPVNTQPFQTGIFSNVVAANGANGGEFYGYAAQVADEVGGHYAITGGEIDVSLHGPNTQRKEGWSIASSPLVSGPDSQHGLLYDAGLGIWAAGTCGPGSGAGGSACAGFNLGISFGRDDSYFPVSSGGTMIGTATGTPPGASAGMIARFGIDFRAVTLTECAYASRGVCIDGDGDYLVKKNFPEIAFWDTTQSTVGGAQRIAGLGFGNWFAWQVNQSADGSFGSVVDAFIVDGAGNVNLLNHLEQPLSSPADTSPCSAGQIAWDTGFIYVCTSTNNWKRAALVAY